MPRRGVDAQFAAIQVHDDTLTQTGATIKAAAYLKAHAPWMVPIVNQAGDREIYGRYMGDIGR